MVETEGNDCHCVHAPSGYCAAHRLGGHPDVTSRPLVKAMLKRLAREYGKPKKQAKDVTSDALALVNLAPCG